MKSKEDFELLVADLTELEMKDLLEVVNDKINRDKMEALREDIFKEDNLDEYEELKDEIRELENKNEKLESKIDRIERYAKEAISTLEEI